MFQALWPDGARPRRCRSARSPTACTPGPGCRRRWTTCSTSYVLAGVGRGRRRRSGPASTTPATTSCGGCREQGRERLVAFVRERLRKSLLAQRACRRADAAWTDEVLDPRAAHHRLRPPLRHLQAGHPAAVPARPAAGPAARRRPAHPAGLRRQGPPGRRPGQGDDPPDRRSSRRDPAVRHRIAFVEDYDIAVARMLYQGCDVWLNTPRRPHGGVRHQRREGGPQRRPQLLDPRRLVGRDVRRQQRLGHLLGRVLRGPRPPRRGRGRQPVRAPRAPDRPAVLRPLRGPGPPPVGPPGQGVAALARARRSSASRMVRDYVERDVRADRGPGRRHGSAATTPGPGPWPPGSSGSSPPGPRCTVDAVDSEDGPPSPTWAPPGTSSVSSPSVSSAADDVAVQLLHGPVGPNDELIETSVVKLELVGLGEEPAPVPLPGQLRLRAGRPLRLRRPGRAGPPRPGHPRRDGLRGLGLDVPQRPTNLALPGPCSRNDATPIRASSVPNTSHEQLGLEVEPGSASGPSRPASMARLARPWATTAPAARLGGQLERSRRGPRRRARPGRPGRCGGPRRRRPGGRSG